MLTDLCQELKNWFELDRLAGEFTISGGVPAYADGRALPLLPGQYYRIVGSVFSDGVHKYGSGETMTSETFTGAVWPMAVPPAVETLAGDIDAWTEANAEALASPYASESFGGYSYTLRSGSGSGGGSACGVSWQDQFSARLRKWRKI